MSTRHIAIHLPDGSVKEVPQRTTPLEIAYSILPRLVAASVVARLMPSNAISDEAVLDFMFWPAKRHRFEWYSSSRPTNTVFSHGHE
jgi:(p)ppGpp synthase/HD superfamily hydrolase